MCVDALKACSVFSISCDSGCSVIPAMCNRREYDWGIILMSPWDRTWNQLGINSCSSWLASPEPRWLLQGCSAISSVFPALRRDTVWCVPRLGHVHLCYFGERELVWMCPRQHSLSICAQKAYVISLLQATLYRWCQTRYFLYPWTECEETFWDSESYRSALDSAWLPEYAAPQVKDLRLCCKDMLRFSAGFYQGQPFGYRTFHFLWIWVVSWSLTSAVVIQSSAWLRDTFPPLLRQPGRTQSESLTNAVLLLECLAPFSIEPRLFL